MTVVLKLLDSQLVVASVEGLAVAQAVAARDGAADQATLARAYAVSDTDAAISGAVSTSDRGAKYWAGVSLTRANNAATAEAGAEGWADAAEAAAQAAAIAGKVYDTITAGRAGTTTGQQFWAPDDGTTAPLWLHTRTSGGSDKSDIQLVSGEDIAAKNIRRTSGFSPPQAMSAWIKYLQSRAQGTVGRCRVLVHGDSVGIHPFTTFGYNAHLMAGGITTIEPNDGVGDISSTSTAAAGAPITLSSLTGGTLESRFDLWPGMEVRTFTSALTITPGASFDYVKVYLRKTSGGPVVDLKIAGTTVASVDTNGSEGVAVITYSTPGTLFSGAITLVPASGTATLYSGFYEDTTQSGMSYLAVGQSGFLLSNQMQYEQARLNYAALLTDFAPTICTFSMEEEDTALFQTAFGQFCDLLDDNAPLADKLYFEPDAFSEPATSNLAGQTRRMIEVLDSRDTQHQFVPRMLAMGDQAIADAQGAYTSGDKIHATTYGQVLSMAPWLAEKGFGLPPWAWSPNAVNAPVKPSKFAMGTTFGAGNKSSFGAFANEMKVYESDTKTGYGFSVPRWFSLTRLEDSQIMFRIGRANNALAYQTVFPPNGYLLVDGTRTALESNQTILGIKSVRFRDVTDSKPAGVEAILVPSTFTVATVPAANLTANAIVRLSDGAQGAGPYVSQGASWLRLTAGRYFTGTVSVPTLAAGAFSSVQVFTASGVGASHIVFGQMRYLDTPGDDIVMHIVAKHAAQIRIRFQNVGASSVTGATRTVDFVAIEP